MSQASVLFPKSNDKHFNIDHYASKRIQRIRLVAPMNRVIGFRYLATVILVLSLLYACGGPATPQPLPADAKPICTVANTNPVSTAAPPFETWFETGSVTLNGVANPADSVHFPDLPNCSFYRWAEHMFLWLTSHVISLPLGTGDRIFNSPIFFEVSPIDENRE